jgi:hypothetical protein
MLNHGNLRSFTQTLAQLSSYKETRCPKRYSPQTKFYVFKNDR